MSVRRIRVRNKTSGEITTVSERAFGYFAADFERVDDAQSATPPGPPPGGPSGTPSQSAQDAPIDPAAKPSRSPRPAATNDKEQ